jgi:hypothetical protein
MGDTSSDPGRIFDSFSNATNNAISSAKSRITDAYDVMSANSTLYIGLFAVVIITVIIAGLLYTYLGWALFSKVENSVDGTKVPVLGTKLNKFMANVSNTANGSRRSFSFWIYINDMNKYKGQYKNILGLSSDATNLYTSRCSPHIFLDKINNSMYIRFTNKYSKDIPSYTPLSDDDHLRDYIKTGIEINYIPLQRWVHIAIVCNTDSYKSTIYAYLDGDLVNTRYNKEEYKLSKNSTQLTTEATLNDINLDMSGFLYVGADTNNNYGSGFSGLLSNFSTYNYELNNKDVYTIYNKGPINGLLASLGLGAYGVRSPVYKL